MQTKNAHPSICLLYTSLRAFRTGADAHSGDGMTDGQIDAALLGQGAGVGDDCQSVHLQLVIDVYKRQI